MTVLVYELYLSYSLMFGWQSLINISVKLLGTISVLIFCQI